MDAGRIETAIARMDDAGLGTGERLAALIALVRADENGGAARLSQKEVAEAARVSLMTAGGALRKLRAAGLARQLASHVPAKGRAARWTFGPVFSKRQRRGQS
jgi:hypothetical protein